MLFETVDDDLLEDGVTKKSDLEAEAQLGGPELFFPYRIYSTMPRRRQLETPMLIEGRVVHSYTALVVKEYIDLHTGEIIPADKVKNDARAPIFIHSSELALRKEYAIGKIRKDLRPFVRFVLKFRNARRGVTPSIGQLCTWYAELTDRSPASIRRNIQRLDELGILNGDVLYPLFQIAGTGKSRMSFLGERESASMKMMHLMQRKEDWLRKEAMEPDAVTEKSVERCSRKSNKLRPIPLAA